jgi:hypothetical protein
VGLVFWASTLGLRMQAEGASPPALKAAFLLNFAKFTDWPEDIVAPTAPIVFCVIAPEMESALDGAIAGLSINQHPVTVSRVKLDAPRPCEILYAGKLDRRRTEQLVTVLSGANVLTVGDDESFAKDGGMIAFVEARGRMRFAVNLTAVERTRLRLSAKLLTLATIIKE